MKQMSKKMLKAIKAGPARANMRQKRVIPGWRLKNLNAFIIVMNIVIAYEREENRG